MANSHDKHACQIKNKQRWQRRKADRPGEIISAALELFVERGFAATRLDDVASHAGVSKGTVYLYFDSKESLFRAVVQEVVVPEVERAELFSDAYQGTSQALIRQLLHNWWQTANNSGLSGIPKLMVAESSNFPELATFYVEQVIHRARKLIAGILQQGIQCGEFIDSDVQYLARVLLAPWVFAVIWERSLSIYDTETYRVEKYLDTHLDVFFNGILMRKG